MPKDLSGNLTGKYMRSAWQNICMWGRERGMLKWRCCGFDCPGKGTCLEQFCTHHNNRAVEGEWSAGGGLYIFLSTLRVWFLSRQSPPYFFSFHLLILIVTDDSYHWTCGFTAQSYVDRVHNSGLSTQPWRASVLFFLMILEMLLPMLSDLDLSISKSRIRLQKKAD